MQNYLIFVSRRSRALQCEIEIIYKYCVCRRRRRQYICDVTAVLPFLPDKFRLAFGQSTERRSAAALQNGTTVLGRTCATHCTTCCAGVSPTRSLAMMVPMPGRGVFFNTPVSISTSTALSTFPCLSSTVGLRETTRNATIHTLMLRGLNPLNEHQSW